MAADFTIRGDTKLDGSGFSEGLSRMGNLAAKGLKVVGASLAAAGVAVGALAKQSLDAYSDYEQMVGGVKTLFGTEADSVEEYAASVGKSVGEVQGEYDALVAAQNKVFADAKNAYKDAGMSANAYMQTVTSFSARLLQGLGGDSQKAAEIANMAVVDMSDNVNKMGSSMTDVQNAYQGFAKQNYTMLDNAGNAVRVAMPEETYIDILAITGGAPFSTFLLANDDIWELKSIWYKTKYHTWKDEHN